MTIPKKGRRRIIVDGAEYYYSTAFERSGRIVIQHGSGRGACLFIFPHSIMKPSHVAEAIRFGLFKGWTPSISPDDCWLAFDVDVNGESLLEFIPNNDFRVVTFPTLGQLPEGADMSEYPDTRNWWNRPVRPENRS
jgi:hypothetical protein